MWSVVSPVAEAGTSTPSPFRMWSVVSPVAETIVAVPLVVVPVHVRDRAVLKSITPIITMPVLIAFARVLPIARPCIEKPSIRPPWPTDMPPPWKPPPPRASEREPASNASARQMTATTINAFADIDNSVQDDENTNNTNFYSIIAALHAIAISQVDQRTNDG